MKQKYKNFGKTFFIYIVLMLLARSCSFIREMILAYKYGANIITDSYSAAVTIETTVFGGIGTAICTSYVPIYRSLKDKEKRRLSLFNGRLLISVILVSFFFIALFYFFPDIIVNIFVAGFNEHAISITIQFTKIVVWSFPFVGIAYVLQGYLQANGHVYLIAFMSFPISLPCIIGILVSSEEKLFLLPFGVLFSNIVLVIYFLIPAFRLGFRQSLSFRDRDNDLKRFITLMIPIFLGQMVMEINVIIDKNLASTLQEGTLTTLSRGYQTAIIVESLIGSSIATIMFPRFADCVEKKEEMKKIVKQGILVVLVVVVPIVITIFVLSKQIVEILFGIGRYDDNSMYLTQTALAAYVIGMIPLSVRVVIEKVFYAMEDTKTPVKNSILGIIINVILDFILIRLWGHIGLALASSIAALIVVLLLLHSLYRKVGDYYLKEIGVFFLKMSIASFVMIICEKSILHFFTVNDAFQNLFFKILSVGAIFFFGLIVYVGVLFLFHYNVLNRFKIKR